MSVMCCVYVPEGIVLAAESRLTRTRTKAPVEISNDEEGKKYKVESTTYTLSDNAQKVLLINKANVGVSFCGNAIIEGITVADYIRRFEIEKVVEEDSVEDVANKLSEYYSFTGTLFFVCGYKDDIPYVFQVKHNDVKRYNVASQIPNDDQVTEKESANNNTDVVKNEENVVYSAAWAGKDTAITKIINESPKLNVDWKTMQLKDAIDFAEFLIDVTIKYERFSDDIQTCGGSIDILVITKDTTFWKQHKIYNPINK